MGNPSALVQLASAPDSNTAIICIPQAGAGTASIAALARSLRGQASVWAARFPGRENRILERPLTTIEEMAASLLDDTMSIHVDCIAFLGHCSGAYVAYELAHLLCRMNCNWTNSWLIVSSQSPPPVSGQFPVSVSLSPELGLAEQLRALGGTPEILLRNAEFLELIGPAIRADFEAIDRYRIPENRSKIPIPIAALRGKGDQSIRDDDLTSWSTLTTGQFKHVLLDGDHFYFTEHQPVIARTIMTILRGDAT